MSCSFTISALSTMILNSLGVSSVLKIINSFSNCSLLNCNVVGVTANANA